MIWWKLVKALLDFDLKKHRMSMNVNIVIDDPEELERVRQKEMDITKARFGPQHSETRMVTVVTQKHTTHIW